MKVGIIVSSPLEAKAFGLPVKSNCIELDQNTVLACCGPGKKGVNKAMLHLTYHDVQGLISWGYAGGLTQDLPTGTLVLPKQLIHPYGPTVDVSGFWHAKLLASIEQTMPISTGPIMLSDEILTTPKQKAFAFERTRAVAADQESFYVAKWARMLELPFVSLRVILDDYNTSMPANIGSLLNDSGHVHVPSLIKVMAKPSHWPEMIKLQNQYKVSQAQLNLLSHITGRGAPFQSS